MISRGFTIEVVTGKTPDATVIATLGNASLPIYPALTTLPTSLTRSSDNPDMSWITPYIGDPSFLGFMFGLNRENFNEEKFSVAINRALSLAPKTTYVDITPYIGSGYYIRFRNSTGWYICTSNPFNITSGTALMTLYNPWGISKGSSPVSLQVCRYYTNSAPYRYDISAPAALIIDSMDGGVVSVGAHFSRVVVEGSSVDDAYTGSIHKRYSIEGRSTVSDGLLEFINSTAPFPPEQDDDDPYSDLPTPGDQPIPGGDNIPEPGFPALSATSTGIVGLFCPSVAQMQQLADFMWTDFGGQGTTVIEVLEEVVEAIKRAISNPLDYIFGLNMIPSQGLNIGASKVVKFGFVNSGVSMPILADHYFRVDCGSLSFGTLCGDSFLDYAPYSKFSIYLPYIGFKDLDPNDLVGHTISVVYHGDAITGGLTAYIFKDGNVMYQYSGGCALNIPLSSDNWGATIAAAASVATGVISAAAVPGAAGVAGAGKALLKGAASNVASNPSLLSPQVMHSGAVTGSPGFMGVQYPFIIREAVNFHSTAGFNKSSGYPAYYYRKLGDVSGYTTVMDAHMSNIPMATQEEIEEIENLLESGVIL